MKRAGKTRLFTALAAASAFGVIAEAEVGRDHINVVGSSTVYPFATAVAENFARRTAIKAPKIETTGSGGGLKMLCAGTAPIAGDITRQAVSTITGPSRVKMTFAIA